MTTTLQLQDTLTSLDSLYVSYKAVLEDAKSQLESLDFEVSDIDAENIVSKLRRRSDFRKSVAESLMMQLTDMIEDGSSEFEDSAAFKVLLSTITSHVEKHMTDQFYDMLNTQVVTLLKSPEFESKVERAVLQHPLIHTAVETRLTLRMFNSLLNDESQQGTTE
tara:strand:+ start:509 stop:1000 length:492 start_codon:yes stop_codon:yes gene_type:complete